MATRARILMYWLASPTTGGPLQVVPAPTVNIRNAANTANIGSTIYAADDPDPTILPQGFAGNADGKIEAYLTNAERVILRCSKTNFMTADIPVDAIFPANRYNPRGAWSAATAYNALDVVSNAGSSWVALRASTGVTPVEGPDWTLVASGLAASIFDAAGDLIIANAADSASRLAIGTAGQLLKVNAGATAPEWVNAPSVIGARAWRSTSQSIPTATPTAISFDSENYDSNAFHDNATNPSRLTVPTGMAGKYSIKGGARFDAHATGVRGVFIRVNGVEVGGDQRAATAGGGNYLSTSTDYALAVGDYVEIFVYQDSGAALNVTGGVSQAWASVALMGV